MSKQTELPGFYEKRKTLFGRKTAPEKMLQTGRVFMDAGRYDDALEFFERCEAADLVRQITATAMRAGDTSLYMRAKKVLKEDTSDEEWTQLAANAEQAGKHTMAYLAHLKAGHEQEAARLRRLAQGLSGPEPPAPAGPPEGAEQAKGD